MRYAQFNRLTGVIAQVFGASPDDVELYRSSGVDVIPCGGDVRFDTHYVSPELELLELPTRPAWWSVWDRESMRWTGDAPLEIRVAEARAARDAALQAYDITAKDYIEAGDPVPAALRAYRQALRDWPASAGFPDITTMPVAPA